MAWQMPHYFTATYVEMVACVKRIAMHAHVVVLVYAFCQLVTLPFLVCELC